MNTELINKRLLISSLAVRLGNTSIHIKWIQKEACLQCLDRNPRCCLLLGYSRGSVARAIVWGELQMRCMCSCGYGWTRVQRYCVYAYN